MKKRSFIMILILNLITLLANIHAQQDKSSDPHAIAGHRFDKLMASQNVELQNELEKIFPESEGYLVTGPLCKDIPFDPSKLICSPVRVICPNLQLFKQGLKIAESLDNLSKIRNYSEPGESDYEFEHYYIINEENQIDTFKLETINSVRYEIALNQAYIGSRLSSSFESRITESDREEMSDYFLQYDESNMPSKLLYTYNVPYIIEGYQNYKDYLYSHAEIDLEFIDGVTAFIPTDQTLQWFKDNAPQEAFPNKEETRLQEEYHEFFERGGDLRIMQTLTREGFDTLQSGEYFFAVSPACEIRFGRELLREEAKRIEEETGKKVPRANHAFLFPGEYVLTAGAFWIDTESENRLVKVNAQSGHYFYSNVTPTIREDIAERSDHYLTTLGHFFKALDSLQIPCDNILVSKLQ